MSANIDNIRAAIETLRATITSNSITPAQEASILSSLLSEIEGAQSDIGSHGASIQSTANRITAMENGFSALVSSKGKSGGLASLDAAGRIAASQIPDSVLLKTDLARPSGPASLNSEGVLAASQVPSYLANKSDVSKLVILELFRQAVASNIRYVYYEASGSGSVDWLANGYLIGGDSYCAYGEEVSYSEIIRMLSSRWIPGVPGLIPDCAVNIPSIVSGLTTSLTFDYMATSAWRPRAIVLGPNGYNDTVRPVSATRAFENASSLKSIVGVIDCRQMKNAMALFNTFKSTVNLQTVLLCNIPNCITELDFSSCPEILHKTRFMKPDGSTSATDTLSFLANNRNRADFQADSGGRTIPLTVYVHDDVYRYLYQNDFIDQESGEGIPGNTGYTGTGDTRIIYAVKNSSSSLATV